METLGERPMTVILKTLFYTALSTACLAAAGGALASPGPADRLSRIEIPVSLSLEPLFAEIEAQVPRQTGTWGHWQDEGQFQVNYQAWRGPLDFQLRGDILYIQAHARYWVKARADVLGLVDVSGSCGVGGEPPRQVLIGLAVRMRWRPDGYLLPEARPLPPRFIDRCEMTAANLDVTPFVAQGFSQEMRKAIGKGMRSLIPPLEQLRREAEILWQKLQQPREIAPGLWLDPHPTGAAVSPLVGFGSTLSMRFGLVLAPALAGEAPPEAPPQPLPPLRALPFDPTRPASVHLDLSLDIDYAAASRTLTELLRGSPLELMQGKRATIESAKIKHADGKLMIELELGGDLAGQAKIWGSVGLNGESGKLELTEVDFEYDARDPQVARFAEALHLAIVGKVWLAGDDWLAAQQARLTDSLNAFVAELAPKGAEAAFDNLALTRLSLTPVETGLRLSGEATGVLRLGPPGPGKGTAYLRASRP